jgi:hypothetical protein
MKTNIQSFAVSVGTSDSPLLGPSESRVAIILSGPLTNRFSISFGGSAVLDQGTTLYPTGAPIILSENDLGDGIRGAIRAISAVATQAVSGHEVHKLP